MVSPIYETQDDSGIMPLGRHVTLAFFQKQPAPASPVNSIVLYIILYGLYMKMNILQFAQYYFTERLLSEHLQPRAQSNSLILWLLIVLEF